MLSAQHSPFEGSKGTDDPDPKPWGANEKALWLTLKQNQVQQFTNWPISLTFMYLHDKLGCTQSMARMHSDTKFGPVVINSIFVTTRQITKSLFEIVPVSIRSKGGWVVLELVWMKGPFWKILPPVYNSQKLACSMAKHKVQQRLMGMKLVSQAGNQRWMQNLWAINSLVVDTVCQNTNKNVNLSLAGGNEGRSQSHHNKNHINFATMNANVVTVWDVDVEISHWMTENFDLSTALEEKPVDHFPKLYERWRVSSGNHEYLSKRGVH